MEDMVNLSMEDISAEVTNAYIPTIAVLGDVDAGKSTMIGYMKKREYDNGNGKARSNILAHKHERETGRTSDIGTFMVRIPSKDVYSTPELSQIVKKQYRTVRMLDLAGHEKYLGTTLRGLTRYFPDFAILLVKGTHGAFLKSSITTEHMRICIMLKIPLIVAVTKIDITPPKVLKNTMKSVRYLCKALGLDLPVFVRDERGISTVLNNYDSNTDRICPVFCISLVVGTGLNFLEQFLSSLTIDQDDRNDQHLEMFLKDNGLNEFFFIHRAYYKEGYGVIIYGYNRKGPISVGDKLVIGPFSQFPVGEEFFEVRVRSIHDGFRKETDILMPKSFGCLCIKSTKRNLTIRKNMIKYGKICATKAPPLAYYLKATVLVSTNRSITIQKGYHVVLHCGNNSVGAVVEWVESNSHVKQNGVTVKCKKDLMRTGETGEVSLKLSNPQVIYPGERFLFRDGRAAGSGIVTEVGRHKI